MNLMLMTILASCIKTLAARDEEGEEMYTGQCDKCGILTSFKWGFDGGEDEEETVYACSALHAPPGAFMVEFNRFEGQEFRPGTDGAREASPLAEPDNDRTKEDTYARAARVGARSDADVLARARLILQVSRSRKARRGG